MAAVNNKEWDEEKWVEKGNENKTKITKSLLRVALFRSRKWNESCCLLPACTLVHSGGHCASLWAVCCCRRHFNHIAS